MRSAVRNTCFAILSSIETDLRETIGDLALCANSLEILSPDVRKNAKERFELDENHTPGVTPENDIDLIDYTDFADLGKMIRLRASELATLCGRDANTLASQLESMTRARNRVCHSRPLEDDDLSRFIDLANSLLRDYPQLQWKELLSVRLKIEQDPTFVLRLEIPVFWTAAAEVLPHNLPMVDFDETGFIGRTTEIRELIKHVSGPHPLVTLIGDGGVGVREVHDAVTSTLGIVQAATRELGSPLASGDLAALVEELRSYMTQFRLLVVIDNLETLTLEDVRPLLESIPRGSKVLLTSRIGLGELELRYKLGPLDKKQSISLVRRHSKSLNLQLLAECAEERIGKYCQSLFFNPLLIKWFVSSVSNGSEPERVLSRGNQSFSTALQFCFENIAQTCEGSSGDSAAVRPANPGEFRVSAKSSGLSTMKRQSAQRLFPRAVRQRARSAQTGARCSRKPRSTSVRRAAPGRRN
jgi:LuxR family glucitol operon transcriptional activator